MRLYEHGVFTRLILYASNPAGRYVRTICDKPTGVVGWTVAFHAARLLIRWEEQHGLLTT
jgi:hypothetical protein